jgi:hypothetical protein
MADIFGALNQATGLTEDPAKVQKDAMAASQAWQEHVYNQTRQDMAPYLESGKTNLNALTAAMGGGGYLDPSQQYKPFTFNQSDPSYQWRLQQGANALTAQGAAMGNLGSGNLGTALVNYGQNAASQEYQNEFNRYQQGLNDWMAQRAASYNMLSGASNPNAPVQMGNFAMQSGVNVGNTLQQGAANQMAGQGMNMQATGAAVGGLANLGKSIYDIYHQNMLTDQYQNNYAYQNYGVTPVDYGGGGNYQGTDMYAGDLWA